MNSIKNAIKSFLVLLLGAGSAIYLLNIGAGVFELIPDNIPIAGNLDELAATVLLLHCLNYFGIAPAITRFANATPAPRPAETAPRIQRK